MPVRFQAMSNDDTMHVGQWFHPALNPPAFDELAHQLAAVTDLSLRRTDNRIGNQFHDVSSKLEISRYHVRSIIDRMRFAREELPVMLADLATDLETNVTRHRRVAASKQLVIEFRDHVLVAHLEGLLIQTKCMLDSISQFYSIAYQRQIRSFSDGGRNVLRDICNLSRRYTGVAEQMKSLIEAAKLGWIDEAIKYRDELVHFGQLRKFRCFHLPLTAATRYGPEAVQDSKMPSGQPTTEYVTSLLQSAHKFCEAWLKLIFDEIRCQKQTEAATSKPGET